MRFYDEILYKLGLPPDQAVGRKVLLVDDRAVFVEGHRGLTVLSDEEIRFRYGRQDLVVRGRELKLTELSPDEGYVVGKIVGVAYEK